jgi:hypothetical protein
MLLAMTPLSLVELSRGAWSLVLPAGETPAEQAISDSGHAGNGYFWEGVAQRLVEERAPDLATRLSYDPEAGAFVAYGPDQDALTQLGRLMATVANDRERLAALIARAEADGFEFDD